MIGDKRYRIWAIYMAGCAYAFWRNWSVLHQVLAIKPTKEALTPRPWERRYQYQEDSFRRAEPDWGICKGCDVLTSSASAGCRRTRRN